MATWADIQRLAADLQRVQSADSEKKLSEANCIEVVSRLIGLNKIDVVVTASGRDYVTRKHLCTEVRNECLASGGRVTITDLVPLLKVTLEHVEDAVATVSTEDDDFIQCAGELLHRDYIYNLCRELNDKLKAFGQLSMLELAKNWNLPTDIFQHYVLVELGRRIDAQRIDDQLYTSHFLKLQRNKLRAALVALTKPTPLSNIYSFFGIPQSLFFSTWNELTEAGHLNGHVVGSKNSLKSVYVPRMHDLLVKNYVKKTFEDTGFISVFLLKKLSVSDVNLYFKDLLTPAEFGKCTFVESGVVRTEIWNDVITTLQDELNAQKFVQISEHLPQVLSDVSDNDLERLSNMLKKKNPVLRIISSDVHVVYDPKIVADTLGKLDNFIRVQANNDAPKLVEKVKQMRSKSGAESNKQNTQNDDDDWGSGSKKKGKGGKKAATKGKQAHSADSDDYSQLLTLEKKELKSEMGKFLNVPDDLFNEVFDEIQNQANAKYKQAVETVLLSVTSNENADLKKTLAERKETAQKLYDQLVVMGQSLQDVSETLALDLRAYLLRTVGLQLAQLVLSMCSDCPPEGVISNKARDGFVASVADPSSRKALAELFDAVTDLDSFHNAIKNLQSSCSVSLQMPDKKQRSQILAEYRCNLKGKLTNERDPPSALLLAILYAFAQLRQLAINASGKFVGALLKELTPDIDEDTLNLLQDTQKSVVELLKKKNADEVIKHELEAKIKKVKEWTENIGQ